MEKAQGANIGVTLACVLTSVVQQQIAGAAINIAGGAVFASFSRQDEAEDDQEGFNNVVRAGISLSDGYHVPEADSRAEEPPRWSRGVVPHAPRRRIESPRSGSDQSDLPARRWQGLDDTRTSTLQGETPVIASVSAARQVQ